MFLAGEPSQNRGSVDYSVSDRKGVGQGSYLADEDCFVIANASRWPICRAAFASSDSFSFAKKLADNKAARRPMVIAKMASPVGALRLQTGTVWPTLAAS